MGAFLESNQRKERKHTTFDKHAQLPYREIQILVRASGLAMAWQLHIEGIVKCSLLFAPVACFFVISTKGSLIKLITMTFWWYSQLRKQREGSSVPLQDTTAFLAFIGALFKRQRTITVACIQTVHSNYLVRFTSTTISAHLKKLDW